MSNAQPASHPDLEERFLEPAGWRWHHFERKPGRKVRFGSIFPKDSIPDAVVICLPGLSEFSEKYFETVRSLLDMNMAVWIMDWVGQGGSQRYLKNPDKRHSAGFDEDVADLHYFILEYIKHSSVHPDKGRIKMALLGHSMGAHIGLRYLQEHPGMVECAGFTAPLAGITAVEAYPKPIAKLLLPLLALMGTSYAPGPYKDWTPQMRSAPTQDIFSSDPVRKNVHNAWCEFNRALATGHVTNKFLCAAVKSCDKLMAPGKLEKIETPCLIGVAGDEKIVSNTAIFNLSSRLPHVKILEMERAKHEILMETDDIREAFLDQFYALVQENIIGRPLNTF